MANDCQISTRKTTRDSTAYPLLWSSFAARTFATTAARFVVPFFGVELSVSSLSSSDGSPAVASLLAAALVGWVVWFGVEQLAPRHPVIGGAVAGLTTGTVSHPVAWFLWPLLAPAAGMEGVAFVTPVMSVYSLLFVGWLTVPMAVITGVLVGAIRLGVSRFIGEDAR